MQNNNILEVSNVNVGYSDNGIGIFSKKQQKDVLKNVSLQIHRNEFFGLVGESGCGKSTLAKSILGLVDFNGNIKVNGLEYSKKNKLEFAKEVQAVFQDPLAALNPHKTIGFTLEEPLKIHKIGSALERKQMVNEMLERIGLDESYADRYPAELSGGQRQRVCIGASLMLHPKLIIADEAISALDVSIGSQILNLFQQIHSQMELSLLFISHNINVVYYLCDRIAVMYKGRIVELGTAEDVCNKPSHPYTRLLMSAIPDITDNGFSKDVHELLPGQRQEGIIELTEDSCSFCRRCPYASALCSRQPALLDISKNGENEHLVRCHHVNKILGEENEKV